MANDYTNTSEHYIPIPAITDKFSYTRDVTNLRTRLNKGLSGNAAWDSNADNYVLSTDNAGSILSSQSGTAGGKVIPLVQDQDPTITFYTHTGAALVAEWTVGADDSDTDVLLIGTGADLTAPKVWLTEAGKFGIGQTPTAFVDILDTDTTGAATVRISNQTVHADADAAINFSTDGNDWAIGSDSSRSDAFIICDDSALNSNVRVAINKASGFTGFGGVLTPDGTVHVHTATAGAVTAYSGADDLVVENSGAGGVSVLTPDASEGRVVFGTPSDNVGAGFRWDYGTAGANKQFLVGTWTGSGILSLRNGSMVERMRFDGTEIGVTATHLLLNTATAPGGTVAGVMVFPDNAGDPTPGTNTCAIYGNDVAGTVEVHVADEANNVTQISPHNPDTGEFYFHSYNTRSGRKLTIHMERLVRFLIAKVSPLLSAADQATLATMIEEETDASLVIAAPLPA